MSKKVFHFKHTINTDFNWDPNIVYKDSAAYFANLSHGDIIIEINGQPIYTANDYFEIKNSASIGDVWNLSIVRNGQIKKISLIFTL